MTFHEDMKYWVWLQRAAGKGANLERLLSPFGGDVRALYEADPGERERLLRETPSESAGWVREEARGAGMRGGWMRDGWRARKYCPAGRRESPPRKRNDRSPKARYSG